MPVNDKISMLIQSVCVALTNQETEIVRAWGGVYNCFGSLKSVSKMQVNPSLSTIEFVLDFGSCSSLCDPMLMFPRLQFDIPSSLGPSSPSH